jgi:hypothetical protein
MLGGGGVSSNPGASPISGTPNGCQIPVIMLVLAKKNRNELSSFSYTYPVWLGPVVLVIIIG